MADKHPQGTAHAVRVDLVERLAETIGSEKPVNDAALARLIGRPVRELPGVLTALGYKRVVEGETSRWRRAPVRRARAHKRPREDNAFSALANLLPPQDAPPRRRRSRPA